MIDERSHPAGRAGSHQTRMPEPTPEPRDLLLEAGGVDVERERAGQHLHQEAVATSQQQEPPDDQLPRFAPGGQLLPPAGWEAWVMVGSSTGLSYAAAPPPAAGAAPGMFHNVYVQPWAYREFVRTGAFPERT